MKKPPKLKPCPFCQGIAELTPNNVGDYYVRCTCCGAMSNDLECGDAICATKRWNQRDKRNKGKDLRDET